MNFDTLIAQIQADINDSSTRTKTRLTNFINDGIFSICAKRKWSFLRVQESDEMSLDSSDMPLAFSDIEYGGSAVPAKFITNVYDTTDGYKSPVTKTTFEQLNLTDDTETGEPLNWFQLNNAVGERSLQFYPLLSTDARTFRFSYIRAVTAHLITSTDPIVIPNDYIYVLVAYVEWRMNKYKSDDRAAGCFNEFKEGIQDMIRDLSVYSMVSTDNNGPVDRFSNGVTGV